MKSFLSECFPESQEDTNDGSIDPLVWVLIVLFVIGIILSISLFLMIDYRQRIQMDLMFKDRTSSEKTIHTKKASTVRSANTGRVSGLSKLNALQK